MTKGRRKIEIKYIEGLSTRQAIFSKRRTRIFKKSSELCGLNDGVETAIIVQSPGERVFAFGHPSVDSVVDKYLAGSSSKSQDKEHNINPTCMHENFIQQHKEITKELEDEKGKKKVMEDENGKKVMEDEEGKKKVMDGPCWWEESFEDLGLEELEKFIASMETLKNNITMRAGELAILRIFDDFGKLVVT